VLISGSAAARDDVCEMLDLDPQRFVVVHHGAGRLPTTPPAEGVRERLGLDGRRVVLCVGAIRPHKNQRLLVDALPHLPEDVSLVLAGRHERGAGDIVGHAHVVAPGYLTDGELEALWRIADCAAFPTRAEGFGLPVVEAMQRGVPVACSDIPVLREVGGDAVHTFDPDDPRAAAAAILAALGEDGARGRARAQRFTWEASAHGTYEAYRRAAS
jgi:glycosyltransferase involved in cell wall biosynthesis